MKTSPVLNLQYGSWFCLFKYFFISRNPEDPTCDTFLEESGLNNFFKMKNNVHGRQIQFP